MRVQKCRSMCESGLSLEKYSYSIKPPTSLLSKVCNDLCDCANYVSRVFISHAVKYGKADQALIRLFRHGEFSALVIKAHPIIWVQVYRDVMHVDAYIFRPQGAKHFCSPRRQTRQIQSNRVEMPGRISLLTNAGNHYSGQVTKRSGIHSGDFATARQVRFQLMQLGNPQSTSYIGKPVIKTEQH